MTIGKFRLAVLPWPCKHGNTHYSSQSVRQYIFHPIPGRGKGRGEMGVSLLALFSEWVIIDDCEGTQYTDNEILPFLEGWVGISGEQCLGTSVAALLVFTGLYRRPVNALTVMLLTCLRGGASETRVVFVWLLSSITYQKTVPESMTFPESSFDHLDIGDLARPSHAT